MNMEPSFAKEEYCERKPKTIVANPKDKRKQMKPKLAQYVTQLVTWCYIRNDTRYVEHDLLHFMKCDVFLGWFVK